MPRVSVVMPVYNSEKYLRQAVDSILDQSFQDFELIAVNDCSTDASLEILQSYKDPRIRIISNEKNSGSAASINRALELARAEYGAHMDADDAANPSRLQRQVRFLEEHPEVALVGSYAVFIDDEGRGFVTWEVPVDNVVIQRTLLEKNCFVHSSFMYRIEHVKSIGAYRPAFKYTLDYDLLLRLAEQHPLANIPEPLVAYRVHANQVSLKKLAAQRRLANTARRLAVESRLRKGIAVDAAALSMPRLWHKLRGCEGTVGSDYLYWADLYKNMGNMRQAGKVYALSLIHSPLSGRAWKQLITCFLATLLSKDQIRTIRWYKHRLMSLFG